MTLVVGLVALSLAWLMSDFGGEDLFRNMVKLFSVATAPIAIPMIAGLWSSRVTHRAALAGFFVGVAAGLVVLLAGPDTFEVNDTVLKKESLIFFSSSITTLLAMFLMTLVDRRSTVASTVEANTGERRRAEAFIQKLDIPIGELAQDRVTRTTESATSPLPIVGISIALIGVLMLAVLHAVEDNLAFKMDLWIGLALLVIGCGMFFGSTLSKRKQERVS
jgi:Na+/proline symporter